MKRKTRRFTVELTAALSEKEARDFIHEAVSTWGKQCFPGDENEDLDPRFEIDDADVKVTRASPARPKKFDLRRTPTKQPERSTDAQH